MGSNGIFCTPNGVSGVITQAGILPLPTFKGVQELRGLISSKVVRFTFIFRASTTMDDLYEPTAFRRRLGLVDEFALPCDIALLDIGFVHPTAPTVCRSLYQHVKGATGRSTKLSCEHLLPSMQPPVRPRYEDAANRPSKISGSPACKFPKNTNPRGNS